MHGNTKMTEMHNPVITCCFRSMPISMNSKSDGYKLFRTQNLHTSCRSVIRGDVTNIIQSLSFML